MGQKMTVPEIERETGIPANTLYHWIRNGLPHQKAGRDYLIDLDELKQFMDERVEVGKVYRLKDAPPNASQATNNRT
jgi:excisionase family DNA binding protein